MPAFDRVLVSHETMMERGEHEEICILCGRPTRWVSLFFEAPLCSTECLESLEKDWIKAHNAGIIDWESEP